MVKNVTSITSVTTSANANENNSTETVVEDVAEEIVVEDIVAMMEGATQEGTQEVVGEPSGGNTEAEATNIPENEDNAVEAENDLSDGEAFECIDEALFNKYKDRMEGAAQLQHAQLPSIAYFSKAPFCDLINQLKRSNDFSEVNYFLHLELLEMAIAYLYKRKNNL